MTGLAVTSSAPQPWTDKNFRVCRLVLFCDTGTETMDIGNINPGDLVLDDDDEGRSSGGGSMARNQSQTVVTDDLPHSLMTTAG